MEQKKIMWVKWDTVCLPKEKGGLGIRDIKNFNLALLGKWRWESIASPMGTVGSGVGFKIWLLEEFG